MLTGGSGASCLGREGRGSPLPFRVMCRDDVTIMLLLAGFVVALSDVATTLLHRATSINDHTKKLLSL
jgi:hypothetical protein